MGSPNHREASPTPTGRPGRGPSAPGSRGDRSTPGSEGPRAPRCERAPSRSRPGHQMPSVIGNKQAPSRKLLNPRSQAIFMARSAASRAATRMPLAARHSPPQPERGRGEPHQRHARHDSIGHPRRPRRDQPREGEMPRPVRDRLPLNRVNRSKRRLGVKRPGQDLGVVNVCRPVLGHEPGDRPDRRHRRGQGDDQNRQAATPRMWRSTAHRCSSSAKEQPGPCGPARSASKSRRSEQDRSVRDEERNNRTDDRQIVLRPYHAISRSNGHGDTVAAAAVRQGPKSRGIDRRRATQARPGVTETITHDSAGRQKNSSFSSPCVQATGSE